MYSTPRSSETDFIAGTLLEPVAANNQGDEVWTELPE